MSTVDILAIGAHPDDIELGCGGTLYQAVKRGQTVVAADLTRGEMSTRGNPAQRQREARAAANILGLTERRNLELRDTEIGAERDQLVSVVRLIRETRPRIVLAPWFEDRHPDHGAAGRLVEQAAFYSGVKKIDELAPHRPETLYHYMLHYPFEPTFVVDITAGWTAKQQALAAYESQFGDSDKGVETAISKPGFLRAMQARDIWIGALIGAQFGEGFCSRGPLGLDTLPVPSAKPQSYRVY